ncbi:MAG TPA: uracil-DNA glycosylase [Candidatus Cryosericum sp.]|nr:uracil-DNA glycosylase [Candidatus Cryosericum sp.]
MASDRPACDSRSALLKAIAQEVQSCTKCDLARSRTKAVPGTGSPDARVCFVGEGPGREEDLSGLPFVGQAGKLLDRMLAEEGIRRSDCYICNIVKCRPPNNRVPTPAEISECSLYLYAQLAVIEPAVVCLLGNTALRFFFGERYSIGQVRGSVLLKDEQRFLPTYHPAAALRNPQYIAVIQQDIHRLIALSHEATGSALNLPRRASS